MTVAFGSSVDDFVSAIRLVRQLARALKSVSGSSAQFLERIREPHGHDLETALHPVKKIEPLPSQYSYHIALQHYWWQECICLSTQAFLQYEELNTFYQAEQDFNTRAGSPIDSA